MPLFFFLAGLFHNESRSLFSHFRVKAKSLLLPCLVAFAAWLLVQAIVIPEILYPAMRDLSINALYGTGNTLFWGQLWFLTSLFITTCFCHLLILSKTISKTVIRLVVAGIFILAGTWFLEWYPPRHPLYWISDRFFFTELHGLPWNVDLLLITSAFYLFGTTFPTKAFGDKASKIVSASLAAIIAFGVVGTGVFLMHWGMDLNNRVYDHWAGSTLVAIFGIGGVLLFSAALDQTSRQWPAKTLSFIGKRSLFILVLHFSLQQNSFAKFESSGIPWLGAVVGSFMIGLVVPIGFSLLWEKFREKKLGDKTNTP